MTRFQSFRPLPSISEQEQEHLISLAMEATGLKQYQRWDTVEYTIIVCPVTGGVDVVSGKRESADDSVGFNQERVAAAAAEGEEIFCGEETHARRHTERDAEEG